MIRNRLGLLREERGWTQKELADLVDVSGGTISAIEKGKYEPSLTLASAMARLFGGRVEDIFPSAPGSPASKGETTTATFLFADIEGSTPMVAKLGASYVEVLEMYRSVLRGVFFERSGRMLDEAGDGCLYVFDAPGDAVWAAVEAQSALNDVHWPDEAKVRVRMGVHTGEAFVAGEFGERFVGVAVHEASRVCGVAKGRQILVSEVTADLVTGIDLVDQGEHELAGLEGRRRLFAVRGAA